MIPMQQVSKRWKRMSPAKKAGIVAFWLVVWELADRILDNGLFLAGPIRTLQALIAQLPSADFWIICLSSFGRLVAGFLLAFVVSFVCAIVAHRHQLIGDFLEPIVALLKTIPMISFVIMMLIWVGNEMLTVYLALLVVFPLIYTATRDGLDAADARMLEMAEVYSMNSWRKFMYIYRPALSLFLLSSCKVSLGMSWKTGIMAEVIGTPRPSIGREMYMAKQYLDTPDLFAWTAVVVVLSICFEKLFMWVLGLLARPAGSLLEKTREAAPCEDAAASAVAAASAATSASASASAVAAATPAPASPSRELRIECLNLAKSFGETEVFSDANLVLESGGIYCLMAPSGAGKTTLLRVICGLEKPTCGHVSGVDKSQLSVMFQEDRLCEELSAVQNVMLVSPRLKARETRQLLCEMLPADCINKPVSELSGGMKRRVSLARSLAHPSNFVILDEPFTGLDNETRERMIQIILEQTAGKTLLVATHGERDAELLGAKTILLKNIARICDSLISSVVEDKSDKGDTMVSSTIDSEKTMLELAKEHPYWAEFLVSKGFPFSLDNPMAAHITFNDMAEVRHLDKQAFLSEFELYVCEHTAAK